MGLEKVLAVIVLYKIALDDAETFQTLLKSIKGAEGSLSVVVYNNSPDYWVYPEKNYEGINIIYVEDASNSGVSKAYNTAYKYAKLEIKEYLLLLDQDTSLSVSLFRDFFEAEKIKDVAKNLFCPMIKNSAGLLSPAKFFLFSSRRIVGMKPGVHPLKQLAIINSGLFISVAFFEKVGGYKEAIKLDFSDFDFLKRCLKYTEDIYVLKTQCQHSLSSDGIVSYSSAINRFQYYVRGAVHYEQSFLESIGLFAWVFLRSIKLDIKYKTLNFTKEVILLYIKRP